jgi:cellulose synthase/poly-beta-1,6-N-acetylglucosamine synthase-like glycosyltransferase
MDPSPYISVLVPVRNEERHLERCLYSLASQDYPRDRFEVLVIDGASTDRTREFAARFAAESTLAVRLLQNPRRLPAAGMNIGLDEARGDVIVRLDGHAHAAPDFLRRSVQALEDTRADCVGGVIESDGDTPVGEAIALAMSSRFGVGGASFRVGGEGPTDTVAFGAYRREVFVRIGGFAEDIDKGEDDEFNFRLLDAGGTIMLVPGIRTGYTVRDDLPGLWRQYFGYGRAKPEVLRRHPAQVRPRQLAPALFVLALGSSLFLAILGIKRPLRSLLQIYALAGTTASLDLVRQHGWKHLPVLIPAFGCLHLAYGLGFLVGLLGLVRKILGRTLRTPGPGPGAHQSTEAPA